MRYASRRCTINVWRVLLFASVCFRGILYHKRVVPNLGCGWFIILDLTGQTEKVGVIVGVSFPSHMIVLSALRKTYHAPSTSLRAFRPGCLFSQRGISCMYEACGNVVSVFGTINSVWASSPSLPSPVLRCWHISVITVQVRPTIIVRCFAAAWPSFLILITRHACAVNQPVLLSDCTFSH